MSSFLYHTDPTLADFKALIKHLQDHHDDPENNTWLPGLKERGWMREIDGVPTPRENDLKDPLASEFRTAIGANSSEAGKQRGKAKR